MSDQQYETAVKVIFSDENYVEDIFFTTDYKITDVSFVAFDNEDLRVTINAYNEDEESDHVDIYLDNVAEFQNVKIVDVELQHSFESVDEESENDEELEEA